MAKPKFSDYVKEVEETAERRLNPVGQREHFVFDRKGPVAVSIIGQFWAKDSKIVLQFTKDGKEVASFALTRLAAKAISADLVKSL